MHDELQSAFTGNIFVAWHKPHKSRQGVDNRQNIVEGIETVHGNKVDIKQFITHLWNWETTQKSTVGRVVGLRTQTNFTPLEKFLALLHQVGFSLVCPKISQEKEECFLWTGVTTACMTPPKNFSKLPFGFHQQPFTKQT